MLYSNTGYIKTILIVLEDYNGLQNYICSQSVFLFPKQFLMSK